MNILLYSSGVDSFISYYYLLQERKLTSIIPVYIDMGHKYSHIEKHYVRKYRPETIFLDLKSLGQYEEYDAFIPVRNLLMCSFVCAHFHKSANNLTIFLGGLKDDRISDNNKEIFDLFSTVLSKSVNIQVKIKSAFDFNLTKYDIVKWYYEDFGGSELQNKTFSCYHPNDKNEDPHCYSCRACFRRNVSLSTYHLLPFNKKLLWDYETEVLNNKDQYDETRLKSMLQYFRKIREKSDDIL